MKHLGIVLALLLVAGGARAQGLEQDTPEDLADHGTDSADARALAPLSIDLPAHVDLHANLPPPGNQVGTDTCVSWAVTYAAGSEALRHDAAADKSLALGPGFTYPLAGGNRYCRGDTKISRTLDILKDMGAPPADEYRFDPGWCGRTPTRAERARAAQFRIRGWHWLDATDVDRVRAQLAFGRPVIFGMPIGPRFAGWRGAGVYTTPEQGPGTAEHAMVLVGYDTARQAFRLMNSLGREWGDGGYGWIGYDAWRRLVRIGFVIDLTVPEGPPRR